MVLTKVIIIQFVLSIFALINVAAEFEGRIVNGTQALEGEFPFMVSLRRLPSGRHSCGASLLNRIWVLTAAHCVSRAKPEQLNIQYGSHTLNPNSTKVANISKIFVHEGYDPSNTFIHDLALLKLKSPITFGGKVRAVRLPELQQDTAGNITAILIGWGLNASGGIIQKHLQKVYLKTFTDDDCSARHDAQLHVTTLCAGIPEGGKGQCSGDSGGPLLVNGTQVGIVSWSRKPCTVPPYPGVFTEVSFYVNWISKTIGDELNDDSSDDESLGELMTGNLIVVSLRRFTTNGHFCAGTILSPTWILTAAHCFTYIKRPHELIVQFGSSKLYPKTKQFVKVIQILKHEGYNPTIAIHDIALLKLKTPLKFNENMKAVNITQNMENDENVILVGWGLNETLGLLQDDLQKVELKLFSLSECRQQLNSILHATNLCAGSSGSNYKKGHCSGDSGGPLLQNNKQIGIVSWSLKPCAAHPGVYTNVAAYTRWIREIIGQD